MSRLRLWGRAPEPGRPSPDGGAKRAAVYQQIVPGRCPAPDENRPIPKEEATAPPRPAHRRGRPPPRPPTAAAAHRRGRPPPPPPTAAAAHRCGWREPRIEPGANRPLTSNVRSVSWSGTGGLERETPVTRHDIERKRKILHYIA